MHHKFVLGILVLLSCSIVISMCGLFSGCNKAKCVNACVFGGCANGRCTTSTDCLCTGCGSGATKTFTFKKHK